MEQVGDVSMESAGNIETQQLFTYSAEEMEDNKINRANAKLIFSPEFIPFRLDIKKKYGLTNIETLVYGFIRFYMSANCGQRFYFTNEQLAEIVDCSVDSVSVSVNKLNKLGLIESSRKMRAGGGQIRFVTSINREIPKSKNGNSVVASTENPKEIENKINKNNIYNTPTSADAPVEPSLQTEHENSQGCSDNQGIDDSQLGQAPAPVKQKRTRKINEHTKQVYDKIMEVYKLKSGEEYTSTKSEFYSLNAIMNKHPWDFIKDKTNKWFELCEAGEFGYALTVRNFINKINYISHDYARMKERGNGRNNRPY